MRAFSPASAVFHAAFLLFVVTWAAAGPLQAQEEPGVATRSATPSIPAADALPRFGPRGLILEAPTSAASLPDPEAEIRRRNDAMLNGALIGLGTVGILDNVVVHWILGWHRAIEDHPHTLEIEIGIVAASAAMVAAGLWRERRTRAQLRQR